jgi:hypothetical protein
LSEAKPIITCYAQILRDFETDKKAVSALEAFLNKGAAS